MDETNGQAKNFIEKKRKICSLIFAGLLASLCFYAFIAVALRVAVDGFEGFSALDDALYSIVKLILTALAIIVVIIIIIWKNKKLSAEGISENVKEKGTEAAAESVMSSSIVLMALAESVGVYGLVLYLLNGALFDFISFGIASLVCLFLVYPGESVWIEVEKATIEEEI